MTDLVGHAVVQALYSSLEKHHGITKDELPYRLDTAYSVLEQVFGVKGARTIGMRVAHRLYQKLNLPFESELGYTPVEYVNIARENLG